MIALRMNKSLGIYAPIVQLGFCDAESRADTQFYVQSESEMSMVEKQMTFRGKECNIQDILHLHACSLLLLQLIHQYCTQDQQHFVCDMLIVNIRKRSHELITGGSSFIS